MTNSMDFETYQSPIEKSFICPICNKICTEATGNEECRHIFCRTCITQKITEENLRACPICKVDFGVAPLQKLRDDWQNIRNNYREKRQYLEKERLPKITKKDKPPRPYTSRIVMTAAENGGIRRSSRKRTLVNPTLSMSEDSDEENDDDILQSPYKPNRLVNVRNKVASRTKQNGSSSKASRQKSSKKRKAMPIDRHLLDVVVALKSPPTPPPPSPTVTPAPAPAPSPPPSPPAGYQYKVAREEEKRGVIEDLNLPSAQILQESTSKLMWAREVPIWFNLLPSDNQDSGIAALPPLASNYLNVKNTVSVSLVKQYLAHKFELRCPEEVDIIMSGRSIPSDMPMKDLLNLWIQTRPESKTTIKVGDSAKNFIMVLYYSRKPLLASWPSSDF